MNDIHNLIQKEEQRQQSQINLIPSENFTSVAVREAVGSVLMHKYSEGNIGKRYYEGNSFVDEIEALAISRAEELFKVPEDWTANVQALSGSNANLAVLIALLEPGDTIMSMYLPDGGHLSHGWSYDKSASSNPEDLEYKAGERKVHIVSKLFNVVQYKTDPQTQLFNYDAIEAIALKNKPKMLITGGTSYPRNIDYTRMRAIADKVGAFYLADIAHEAGLVSAGVLESPIGVADVVTMTTHKTLRAARGAIILSNKSKIKKINNAILPGLQGGPFNNNIAGIAVGLAEASQPEFKDYAEQVLDNRQVLGEALILEGFKLVSGGGDKHLLLIDLSDEKFGGSELAAALNLANIVANKNTIPAEQGSPMNPSGLRVGTPFVTTQGMGSEQMRVIAKLIAEVANLLREGDSVEEVMTGDGIKQISDRATQLAQQFALPLG